MIGFVVGILLFMVVALIIGYKAKCEEVDELEIAHESQVVLLREQFFSMQEELQAKLAELQTPVQTEEEPETGSFVKHRAMRRATPETYRNVFDIDINGQRVLDHLQLTFANKSTYVRGGQDAERESCFKAGQANVIGFIFNQINQVNNPDYKEDPNA